jgi:hypothetical protein
LLAHGGVHPDFQQVGPTSAQGARDVLASVLGQVVDAGVGDLGEQEAVVGPSTAQRRGRVQRALREGEALGSLIVN